MKVQWYYSRTELSQQFKGLWVISPVLLQIQLNRFDLASAGDGAVMSVFSPLIMTT